MNFIPVIIMSVLAVLNIIMGFENNSKLNMFIGGFCTAVALFMFIERIAGLLK